MMPAWSADVFDVYSRTAYVPPPAGTNTIAASRSPLRTWWIACAAVGDVLTVTPFVCSSTCTTSRGRGRAHRDDRDRARR